MRRVSVRGSDWRPERSASVFQVDAVHSILGSVADSVILAKKPLSTYRIPPVTPINCAHERAARISGEKTPANGSFLKALRENGSVLSMKAAKTIRDTGWTTDSRNRSLRQPARSAGAKSNCSFISCG